MPRNSSSSRKGNANTTASASGKAASKELERIDQFFYSYASKSSGMIDPEGIEALCSDLNVDHTDVRVLLLAWKMQAEKQGYFTQDEWRTGLQALRADTIQKLKKALVDLDKEVRRQSNFVEFYSYAFRYCLTEEKQKSIDIESICLLLELVLGPQFRPQVDALNQYLKIQIDYKVINLDQWMGFFRFCNELCILLLTMLTVKREQWMLNWRKRNKPSSKRKQKRWNSAASNPELLEVKKRLNKLEVAVKEIVVESKKQSSDARKTRPEDGNAQKK